MAMGGGWSTRTQGSVTAIGGLVGQGAEVQAELGPGQQREEEWRGGGEGELIVVVVVWLV